MFILVFGFALLFNPISAKAGTAGHSADDAINWVKSKVGQGLDYDGAYGNQCVDLICYYYAYLGQKSPGGNGADYSWNQLPAGWQRIQGAQPQKGDILVYSGNTANPYGHVAIYAADRETYHQNFNSHPYVEKVTYSYNRLGNPYWGVIRPDFGTQTTNNFTSVGASEITTSSAKLTATTSLTYISECGYRIGKSMSSMNIAEKENPNANTLNIWYTASNLESGTTYYYQFYYINNGNVVWSDIKSFTTQLQTIKTTGISLSLSSMSFKIGESYKISVAISPSNATNKNIIWSSDNPSIATVSNNGKVVAVKAGTAHITAKTEDTGITATFTALVMEKVDGVWKKDSTGWWYQNANGSYPKNQWKLINKKWYYFDARGYMQTGWQKINSKWYYLNTSGEMQTGWQKINSKWYYLNTSGKMQTGWQKINSKWYYLNTSGKMQTGWQKINSKWYYLKPSGEMQTGWLRIGNTWYYLKSDGAMASNEWVENGKYYVDSNGHWKQN